MYTELNDKTYSVKLIRKTIKNMYFKWDKDVLVVTCNNFVSTNEISKIIKKNEKSLIRLKSRTPVSDLLDDEMYYLGGKYKIVFDGISQTHIVDNKIISKNQQDLDKFFKSECIRIFNYRLNSIKLQFDNLPDFRLRIRKMSTRWGVCNTKSMTVTLNSELIKKDITLIDYVIIHELCHFKHMNHSEDFWKEVEKYYPYHKKARKMLRESQND